MQLKWLKDFVALAETRSFSEAAIHRHVTQPAFGRRVRALENWVGVELIDRGSSRPALTPAGNLFLELATEIIHRLEDTRAVLRGKEQGCANTLVVAASHTVGVHYYPKFIRELDASPVAVDTNLMAVNSHEGILRLVDRGCDLLLSYHHPQIAVALDRDKFPFLTIGSDVMVPLSAPGADGEPLHNLPGTPDQPVDYLTYTPEIYMGRAVASVLERPPEPVYLRRCYATDMAQALKAMMLEGRGLGWLPLSAVEAELEQGRLMSAVPRPDRETADAHWSTPLELRLYRAFDNPKPVLDELWDWLVSQYSGRVGTRDALAMHAVLASFRAESAFAGLKGAR